MLPLELGHGPLQNIEWLIMVIVKSLVEKWIVALETTRSYIDDEYHPMKFVAISFESIDFTKYLQCT
jgi:hypothetical protein